MNHKNKTLRNLFLSSSKIIRASSFVFVAAALIVGGFFVATGTAFATTATLTLTQKNLTTWVPVPGGITADVTISTGVDGKFSAGGVPSGYTLVYYPDTDTNLNGIGYENADYTGLVYPVVGTNMDLPMPGDLNGGDTSTYCENEFNPDATVCEGAKLWLIPEGSFADNGNGTYTINWSKANTFLFETDLINYEAALNAEIVVAQTAVAAAVVGAAPGQYTQLSVDTLNAAITAAQAVTETEAQSVVDAAVVTLTDAVSAFQPNSVNFNATIALTEAGKWALMSAPTLLSEAPTFIDDAGGAIALLVYKNGVFVTPSEEDMINPLNAFYVRTTSTGKVGLKFATISDPAFASKQLSAGWNLVGTNYNGLAKDEFATLRPEIVALFVPDTYNSRKGTDYIPWDEDANHDLNADPITELPADHNLSKYDGYWVFMNAIKAFAKSL